MTTFVWLDLGVVLRCGDPLIDDPEKIEVPVPEGWHRVFGGNVREGDRHLDKKATRSSGEASWIDVVVPEDDPATDPVVDRARRSITSFVCVIRPGPATERHKECERCRSFGRSRGMRFCEWCITHLNRVHQGE